MVERYLEDGSIEVETDLPILNKHQPCQYVPDMLPKIIDAILTTGATTEQLAQMLGISTRTFYRWLTRFPQLRHAVRQARHTYDSDLIECALARRANGYEVTEVTQERNPEGHLVVTKVVTKHLPPDVGAIKEWLHNRRHEEWGEKQQIEITAMTAADAIEAANRRKAKLVEGKDESSRKAEREITERASSGSSESESA